MKKGTRKSATESRKDAKGRARKSNAQLVRQMMRGFKRVNMTTALERRAWLERLTTKEARQEFEEINQIGDHWKQFGGNLLALERKHIAEKVKGREFFIKVARRRGLI